MAVRTWGMVAAASLAMAVVASIVGSVLEARGSASPSVKITIIATAVGAFIVLAIAIPPLALRAFLAGQVTIGNAEHPIVAFLLRHETGVVRCFWALMATGAAIALPAILRELGLRT